MSQASYFKPFLVLAALLALTACGSSSSVWDETYTVYNMGKIGSEDQ